MEVRQPPAEKMHQIHRRKSSAEEDENLVLLPNGDLQPQPDLLQSNGHDGLSPPSRNHVHSSPAAQPAQSTPLSSSAALGSTPPSAGSYRPNYGALSPRTPNGANGHPSSPFRSTFGHARSHSRTGSMSSQGQNPFAPPLSSPLSGSFPPSIHVSHSQSHPSINHNHNNSTDQLQIPTTTPSSASEPSLLNGTSSNTRPNNHNRRHSRLHSRNLSIFFPRPGSLPESTISEDGTQEIQLGPSDVESAPGSTPQSAPISDISTPDHQTTLQGFTFGGRPGTGSSSGSGNQLLSTSSSNPGSASRRGHHHKHSLSHQFFSFLEPGSDLQLSDPSELHTQPTPVPVSPWNPISPFPESAAPNKVSFGLAGSNGHAHSHTHDHEHEHEHEHDSEPTKAQKHPIFHYVPSTTRASSLLALPALYASVLQFILGSWLWVSGQQIGSLACTGLGYWVVFDAFGVGISGVLPVWLSSVGGKRKVGKVDVRRPYGNARIETVAMFAQSVYLMFSSVYVCKETVEHLLLSAGEGHHHHHGDEEPTTLGIEFPVFLVFITLLSILFTALYFNNHTKLVNTAGNHIPPLRSIVRDTFSRYPSSPSVNKGFYSTPMSPTATILANPFILSPISFCMAILLAATFLPLLHYRTFDLVLAAIETAVTFNVAYRASVVLGTVLLQTSPERGLSGGRMEAFLRAMKEVERHPQVLHLPAPHIWQLTPTLADTAFPSNNSSSSSGPSSDRWPQSQGVTQSLVVTMELHVRPDLGDDDVLELTRWTWERCVSALHFGTGRGGRDGERTEAEVTVGVVRG